MGDTILKGSEEYIASGVNNPVVGVCVWDMGRGMRHEPCDFALPLRTVFFFVMSLIVRIVLRNTIVELFGGIGTISLSSAVVISAVAFAIMIPIFVIARELDVHVFLFKTIMDRMTVAFAITTEFRLVKKEIDGIRAVVFAFVGMRLVFAFLAFRGFGL